MARSSYDDCLRRLLLHEGGYTNNPSDPGGPTNFGITIFDYRKYVKPGATAADVKAMSVDEAKRIYRAKYWDAQRCDDLPAGVDDVVFDYGVNSGIGRSGKVLRRCLGLPDKTSVVDDAVVAAAGRAAPATLINAICDERLRFLQSLKTWPVFGKGWSRRVAEVRTYALSLAGAVASAPVGVSYGVPGKGAVPVANDAQKGSAGAAVVVAGGTVAATQASNWTQIALVIAVTAALCGGGYLFWRWRQRRRQEAAA